MLRPIVLIFLALSSIFALVHLFAMYASLYWYYPWFDIMMHFGGGLLIGIGLHAFGTFSRIKRKPTAVFIALFTLAVVLVWEAFELSVGLSDLSLHFVDTIADIFNGIVGAILAHFVIKKFKI